MVSVAMFAHHVTEQYTARSFLVTYAAVAVADGSPKPLTVKGWCITTNPDAPGAFEFLAAYAVLEKLNQPCDIHLALVADDLESAQPHAQRSVLAEHHWSALVQKARRNFHRLSFVPFDPGPDTAPHMEQAVRAAMALADEWRERQDRAERFVQAAVESTARDELLNVGRTE